MSLEAETRCSVLEVSSGRIYVGEITSVFVQVLLLLLLALGAVEGKHFREARIGRGRCKACQILGS